MAKAKSKLKLSDAFAFLDEDKVKADPLDVLASEVSTSTSASNILVPNQFPSIPPSIYRIALIGDCPGEQEEKTLIPFVGFSGRLLDNLLSKVNISRSSCFVGNVCQIRPPKDDIGLFDFDGYEIQTGLSRLQSDLEQFKPHICVLLGKTSLFAAHYSKSIGDWRGSLFVSNKEGPFKGRKCLPALHPSYCLRQYSGIPLLIFDLKRALEEGKSSELVLPPRKLISSLSFEELIQRLDFVLKTKPKLSCDIEGGVANMSCISIADSSSHSFIVPFTRLDGSTYWTIDQEVEIMLRLSTILADPQIKKVWQNGLYDRFVLQWAHSIIVRNSSDDTMLKAWEWNCEFEKSLGFLCSVLTREPYYKFERKAEDQRKFYEYCCKDSAVTLEISDKLDRLLDPSQRAHCEFNNILLNPLLYMEVRGIKYNQSLADTRLDDMRTHVCTWQNKLDEIAASYGVIERLDFSKPNSEILSQVQSICGYAKDRTKPKADFVERGYYNLCPILLSDRTLSESEQGSFAILTKTTLNTKSSKKFQSFLYDTLGLPTQYKKDPKTKELRPTTDYESILKLTKSSTHPALNIALELSRLRTRQQMLTIKSYQGRMHCSYNLVGSETGRVTSSKSMIYVNKSTRVGNNLQTIPDDWDLEDEQHPLTQGMRDLFIADDGCYLFKADLKGADGWTIGAYMAMLGDRTMLDDLLFGLKPAHFPAYILKFGAEDIIKNFNNRPALKELFKKVSKDDWEYFVSKQGIWGTCYLMGPRKLAERVFIESEGKVNLSEKDARTFQESIFIRYKVKKLHDYFTKQISSHPYPFRYQAPNGHVRKFWGRKEEVLGEVLAHMPQTVTTYATLKAAFKLWTDSENRMGLDDSRTNACRLRLEPLHQVHDELLMQAKIEDTTWAIGKIKQYFDNPIVVANQTITIPFDGAYGTAWSMDEQHKVGEIK